MSETMVKMAIDRGQSYHKNLMPSPLFRHRRSWRQVRETRVFLGEASLEIDWYNEVDSPIMPVFSYTGSFPSPPHQR